MAAPPSRDRRATARRVLGRALPIVGWTLVIGNVLVATGLLPLWRPSVPPPAVLMPATSTGPAAAEPGWSLGDWVAFAAPRATPAAALPPGPAVPAAEAVREARLPGTGAEGLRDRPFRVAQNEPATEEPPSGGLGPALALGAPAPPSPTATAIALPTAVPALPPPGLPVHLVIPSIRVDTPVVELHTTVGPDGAVEWETVPFVAGYYATTGLAGAPTNVVISGHVTTTDRGNVFRDLYRVRPGEPLVVYTDRGQLTYRVEDVRLVKPDDLSTIAPTTQPRLTLVTCAGQFDYRTHTFSERLVVVGQLVTA